MFTILSILTGGGLIGGIAMMILRPALRATVGGFARSIPGWLWAVLGGLLLLGGLYWMHTNAVSSAYERGKFAGAAAEKKDWQVAFAKMKRAAYQWRAESEAQSDQITELTGAQHDQALRDNSALAGALRLRGPNQAAACGRSVADTRVSSAASTDGRPASPADAPRGPVPTGDGLAIVPWGWLVQKAEDHDNLRARVTAWDTWYDQQRAAHDAAVKRLRGEFPEPAFGQ